MTTLHAVRLAIRSDEAKTGAAEFKRSADSVQREMREIGTTAQRGSRDVGVLEKGIASVKRELLTLAAGFAGFQAVRSSIELLSGFERQLGLIRAVTTGTEDELDALEQQALDLGKATEFTASAVADAAAQLGRAGFSRAEIAASLRGLLDLSTSGFLDLGEAAEIAGTALRQFTLPAEQIGRVSDVLAAAANSASTDVQQLGEALNYAGPIAASLGLSIEEVAGALASLANAGIRGSQAGTSLRAILASLIDPTAEAKELVGELGLRMSDLDPRARGLVQVFEELKRVQLGAGEATRLFERESLSAALTLTRNADELDKSVASLRASEGAAARAAETIRGDLKGSLDSVSSAWEGLRLEFGKLIEPDVESASNTLRDLLRDLTGAVEALRSLREESARAQQDTADFFHQEMGYPSLPREGLPAPVDSDALERTAEAARDTAHAVGELVDAAERSTRIDRVIDLDRLKQAYDLTKDYTGALEREVELVRATGAERDALALALEYENELRKAGVQDTTDQTYALYALAQVRFKEIEQIKAMRDEAETTARHVRSTFEQVGSAIGEGVGGALESVIFDMKDLEDAARELLAGVLRDLFQILVTQQLARALSGAVGGASGTPTPSAHGNVFSGNQVGPVRAGRHHRLAGRVPARRRSDGDRWRGRAGGDHAAVQGQRRAPRRRDQGRRHELKHDDREHEHPHARRRQLSQELPAAQGRPARHLGRAEILGRP